DVFETLERSILVDGFHVVVDLDKSHGSMLVDARDGKEYLDFYTYFATLPVGHNHPRLADPEFQKKLLRASIANPANSDVYTVEFAEFVETFREIAQRDYLPHAFFIAGGGLGVENALKAAFDWKIRKNQARGIRGEVGTQVIHFQNAFHGRTGYTLSLTNTADPRKTALFPKFDWPRVQNPKCVFPLEGENLRKVEAAEAEAIGEIRTACEERQNDIAALIIEPIQGEGGDNHFRTEFFQELRRLADAHEFLLIFDEVQSGVGLTGKFWAYEHFGVKPDAVAFGKKMQVCGFVGGPRFDEVERNVFVESSRLNSTWGGNLADMVRGQRYLEIIEEENLVENARKRGDTLLKGLRELEKTHSGVTQARGRGLMAAFDLPTSELRTKVLETARDHGVLALSSGTQSIRFRPALTITDDEIHRGIEILDRAIRSAL
ncbi:MAG TPA: L-lysine 6-transaminase, partial [Candidatus Eisenbacteria bacterium]|nr:L-lysine 6-transaminase [Candidatus Eisenbacteria bacterium]